MRNLRRSISSSGASVVGAILFSMSLFASASCGLHSVQSEAGPIRVGVLHSLTGTMAISEKPVVDATLLAIHEINEAGGILGRRVEPIVVDGASDSAIFARQAKVLIEERHVSVIFGCWTSASRKTVRAVVEKYGHLLLYPVQFEGLEQSPNIVYTGAAPNQQILPAFRWAVENLGKRVFLVGSDYVFPRAANAIMRDQAIGQGAQVLGEEYISLGGVDIDGIDGIVQKIARARPDVILNTINGDSNLAFFRALRAAGISSADIPTISFSIGETEFASMGAAVFAGDYAAWSYIQNLDSDTNRDFVRRFKKRYGDERVVSDPMEAAYVGVHLWANAVDRSKTDQPVVVAMALSDTSMAAPEGIVYVDASTHYLWKHSYLGKIRADGQFALVWSSVDSIRPIPFPPSRSAAEWERTLVDLQRGWNGAWASPAS